LGHKEVFHTEQQLSSFHKSLFFKKLKMPLLVVMSAVDWWKSAENKNRLGFLPSGVRWIFLRLFGKALTFSTKSLAG
jgi:hypothetical protein